MIYISHLFSDQEMREVIEKTGAGVESIDFSITDNLDRLSVSIENYRGRLREMGAKDLTIHGPFLDLNPMTFDREIMKVVQKRFAQAYTAAEELGAKKVVYHTGYHPQIYFLMGWADRMADFFHEFLADRTEIQVVMENVFEKEWEPLLEVKKKVTEENFSLCLDVGHAHCYSDIPVTEWASQLAPAIGHLHLHDNLGDRDAHLAIGDGTIEMETILKTIGEQRKGDCTYTIECNTKDDAITSFQRLKCLLSLENSNPAW